MAKKKPNPLNIFLLGDPAAGKATQAAFLIKKYHLIDFDMGKKLRQYRLKNKQLDKTLSQTTDKGNLTPTKICQQIFKDTITSTPAKKGILFNGTPKMLVEAKLAASLLKRHGRQKPIVIYLSIPMTETVKRMHNRVEYFKNKFSKRPDDSVAALKNRVAYYRKNVSAVVKFFKSKYIFKKISGLGTKKKVEEKIQDFIKRHIPKD